MMGILGRGDSVETDANSSSCDPYLQDFFLYCYQMFINSDKSSKESEQGPVSSAYIIQNNDQNTYVKIEKEKSVTPSILTWSNQSDIKKWNNKIRKYSKQGQDSYGNDCEMIDLDVLLGLYLQQFLQKKKKNQKSLSKNFAKFFNEQEGIFSIDEIRTVAQSVIPDKSHGKYISYAGDISIFRAFLHALTTGSNNFTINSKQFLQSCTRFGIDNPFPFISKRLAIFGNDVGLEEFLQNAGIDLSKAIAENQMMQTGGMGQTSSNGMELYSSPHSVKNKKSSFNLGVKNAAVIAELKKGKSVLGPGGGNIGGAVPGAGATTGEQISSTKSNKGKQGSLLVSGGGNQTYPSAPSFTTSSSLFAQHFSILRELRQTTRHLKTVADQQKDDVESVFKVLDKIISVLDNACQFLNFPVT